MGTNVRRAGDGDRRAVGDIHVAARAAMTYLPRLHTDDEIREHFAGLISTYDTWVYVTGAGDVCGFAIASEKCLEHLYVDPSAQGRGFGGALLQRVMDERPDGFTLWTFQDNTGARRFYERAGLRLVRLTDGSDNEERVPDALYEWQPT
ncbi:MAG: hypothetical protein QOC60_1325 [Frankiaceae bacterium]|nr:hypothetical protein [Frankiaceae bacterium]